MSNNSDDQVLKKARKAVDEAVGISKEKITYNASFNGLCDIVLDEKEIRYLTFKDGVLDSIEVDGIMLQPPPAKSLPPQLKIPRLEKVLEYAQNHGDAGETGDTGVCTGCTQLFYALVSYHEEISDLPDPNLYKLIALWDFHTYAMEKADYSPIIYFYSVAERGKSRTLKGMTYVAYRGIRKGDIRDSQLIRDCTNLCATLAFDMTDFWEKVKQSGSQDVILNRYESGTTVSRVNRPEKGAFRDTDYYDVFGPTVLATNEIINEIADTRSIPITMLKADRDFDNIVTPESGLDLKEQLTAWRYVHLNDTFPKVNKMAKSRLGDITRPLYQILMKVAPKEEQNLKDLINKIEKSKLTDMSNSINAEILQAWNSISYQINDNVIPCKAVTDSFNEGKEDRERFASRRVGSILKSLGFYACSTSNHTLGFIYEEERTVKLLKEYGVLSIVTPVNPETPETPDIQAQMDLKDAENTISQTPVDQDII